VRAAVIEELGGEPVLREVPQPVPGEGDRLVALSAAALNPADLVYAAGIRLQPPIPYVPGLEGVGRLEDGSRVYVPMAPPPHGTFAEYTVVPKDGALPLPEDVSDEQALCVGVAGTTAWLALTWKGGIQPGESVLVTGATGAVGQVAVQAAVALGASRVVAAGRDRDTLERLQEVGASEVVVLDGDYQDALTASSAGGFDLVIDALFGEPMMAAIRATRMGGRIVNLGMRAGRSMQLDGIALKGKDLLSCNIGNAPSNVIAGSYASLVRLVQEGRLQGEHETVALEDVGEVWRRQDSSPHRKLLLAV
jgi:NADPH2:quinone reductase